MLPFQTDMFSGQALRDAGISLAADNAERKEPGWNEMAFAFLKHYILYYPEKFKTEDFREWAEEKGLKQPPHLRAYGSVILRAARQQLIKRAGFIQVDNPKAHKANASLWEPI